MCVCVCVCVCACMRAYVFMHACSVIHKGVAGRVVLPSLDDASTLVNFFTARCCYPATPRREKYLELTKSCEEDCPGAAATERIRG